MLVVVEGSKTEPNYFKGLRHHLRLAAADVQVVSGGGTVGTDPLTLVNETIRLRNVAASERRPYWKSWTVFDHEQVGNNPKLPAAVQRAREHKIWAIVSNPSFELWLLWHFHYTTKFYLNCDAVIEDLLEHHPGYAKGGKNLSPYMDSAPTAVKHGEQAHNHWRNHDFRTGYPNSWSNVNTLVQELLNVRRDQI